MIQLNLNIKILSSSLKYIIIFIELILFINFLYNKNNNSSISNNYFKMINIKRKSQNAIFKILKKNKTFINTLNIKGHMRFGNYFISLNNAIIFCELLSCKRIILKSDFIKHKIFYHKYNITIESDYSFKYIDNYTINVNIYSFFFDFIFIDLGNVNRFYIFRKEILNNLPKVKINFYDLYIYIRGGDIFRRKKPSPYFQPPLCFYKSILNQFIFRRVIIISEDLLNIIKIK